MFQDQSGSRSFVKWLWRSHGFTQAPWTIWWANQISGQAMSCHLMQRMPFSKTWTFRSLQPQASWSSAFFRFQTGSVRSTSTKYWPFYSSLNLLHMSRQSIGKKIFFTRCQTQFTGAVVVDWSFYRSSTDIFTDSTLLRRISFSTKTWMALKMILLSFDLVTRLSKQGRTN